jgi:hypothetical protein
MDAGVPLRDVQEAAGLVTLAGKRYQGAPGPRSLPGEGQARITEDACRAHARLRGLGERANAQLEAWRILRKLRCCPWRTGQLARAIHTLEIHAA